MEVENGKMRDDLKKLRDALSDEAGEDNAQFKEMIGELQSSVQSRIFLNALFVSPFISNEGSSPNEECLKTKG